MFKLYPRVSNTRRMPKSKGMCNICGEPATHITEIRNSCFRGDDDSVKRCDKHKMTDVAICT